MDTNLSSPLHSHAEDTMERSHGGSISAQDARRSLLLSSPHMTPDVINYTMGMAFVAVWLFILRVTINRP